MSWRYLTTSYLVPLIVRQTGVEIAKLVFKFGPGSIGDDDIETTKDLDGGLDYPGIICSNTGILPMSANKIPTKCKHTPWIIVALTLYFSIFAATSLALFSLER